LVTSRYNEGNASEPTGSFFSACANQWRAVSEFKNSTNLRGICLPFLSSVVTLTE